MKTHRVYYVCAIECPSRWGLNDAVLRAVYHPSVNLDVLDVSLEPRGNDAMACELFLRDPGLRAPLDAELDCDENTRVTEKIVSLKAALEILFQRRGHGRGARAAELRQARRAAQAERQAAAHRDGRRAAQARDDAALPAAQGGIRRLLHRAAEGRQRAGDRRAQPAAACAGRGRRDGRHTDADAASAPTGVAVQLGVGTRGGGMSHRGRLLE